MSSPVLSSRGLVSSSADDNPLAAVQRRNLPNNSNSSSKPSRSTSTQLHLKRHSIEPEQTPETSDSSTPAASSNSPSAPAPSSTPPPAVESKQVSTPASASTSEPQHVNPRSELLLVEDVRVSQRVARVALSRARFRVDVAGDGVEAVDMYRAKNYDIILMDIQLPRLTGDLATRQIREIEKQENRVPVIIFGCTGSLSPTDLENYQAAGMNGVIGKGSILESAVPEALAEHEAKPQEFIVCKMSILSNTSSPISSPSPMIGSGRQLSSRALPSSAASATSSPASAESTTMSSRALSSRAESSSSRAAGGASVGLASSRAGPGVGSADPGVRRISSRMASVSALGNSSASASPSAPIPPASTSSSSDSTPASQ